MDYWTRKSIEIARQWDYIYRLHKLYPFISSESGCFSDYGDGDPEDAIRTGARAFSIGHPSGVEAYYIGRPPSITETIAGPPWDGRSVGRMFKAWIDKGVIGSPVFNDATLFCDSVGNAVFNGSDEDAACFCEERLGLPKPEGAVFIARFNDAYVVGEPVLVFDPSDPVTEGAISKCQRRVQADDGRMVAPIRIMDGALYFDVRSYRRIPEGAVVSALILREFLYSLRWQRRILLYPRRG